MRKSGVRGARTLQNQLPHACGIRLPAHRLHHRTDDGARRLHLSVTDLREDVRLRGEGVVDRGDQRTVVRDDCEAAGVDPRRCAMFGDGRSDMEALDVVGEPVAVHPMEALAERAAARGWPVLDLSLPG